MIGPRHLLAVLALSCTAPATAAAAPLTIEVRGLSPSRGQVLLGVCTERQFLSPKCAWQTVAAATARSITVTTPPLKPGRYAVQAVYDLNRNYKMDANAMGIPTEPAGFSRDAAGLMGPPRFADAAVSIDGPGRVVISVR